MDTIGKHLSIALTLNLVIQDLIGLELQSSQEVKNGSFKLLDVLHHFSSGMKALVTDYNYVGLDELRQACGGAGFLLSSGIADWWAESAPFPTYEGVNVIMYQQSSRMLLKQATRIKAGKAPSHEFFNYLAKADELVAGQSGAITVEQFMEPDHIQRALATRAIVMILRVHKMLTESKAPSKTRQNELFAIDVNRMTRLHLTYIIYERARSTLEKSDMKCQNFKKALHSAMANYALKQLTLDSNLLYESGFFGRGSGDLLDQAYKQTLIDLRPNMIGLSELVPAANMPSTIGNEYGDIYECQFETAKNSSLNTGTVPDMYYSHIKPVMQMNTQAKL